MDEAAALALRTLHPGADPGEAWRPRTVSALRRTAARWADDGRQADLSEGFRAWLREVSARHPGRGFAGALAAVEQDTPLLQAFDRLPGPLQEELWRGLGRDADHRPPALPARAAFLDTYWRVYAARVPARACRQLVARLGDAVRRDTAPQDELARHLPCCAQCSAARAELAAVRDWHRPVLVPALLLWTGGPCPAPEPAPDQVVSVPPPRRRLAPRAAAAAVAAAAALALALAAAAAALPDRPPVPAAAVPAPTSAEPTTAPPTRPPATPTTPAPPVSPTPSRTAPSPTPSRSRTTPPTVPPSVPPPVPPPTPVVTVTVVYVP
ncbi:hypothetical protein BX265_6813 [Streptomyces sp. TLI_235]|nr:hypothetical protein [Streptomyces sp. TLI_235]PBC72192.1 hypothetical protein BX265_6813 [Streptomyces sp. TLI_235]